MKKLLGYIKKYGIQTVVTVMTVDSYRRQIINDKLRDENKNINSNKENERNSVIEFQEEYNKLCLEDKRIQTEALDKYLKEKYDLRFEWSQLEMDKQKLNEEKDLFSKEKELFEAQKNVEESNLKIYREAYNSSIEKENKINEYNANKSEKNKIEMDKAIQDFESIKKELDNINKSDIGDIFWVAYDKYNKFLDTLTPDKIVCVFNILIGSMTLSSFFTVLSILLSENLINRITFLDKYPRILKLIRLRNNINRKISKFYLLTHVVVILGGLIGNIYMFSL